MFWENVRESDEIRGKLGGLGKGMEIRRHPGDTRERERELQGKSGNGKDISNYVFLCFRLIELRNMLFNYLLNFLRETWTTHSFIVNV